MTSIPQIQTVETTGAPPTAISNNWFGNNVYANMWHSSVFATTDATRPTIGGQIAIDHAVGGDNPYNVFAVAWFDVVVGRANGGNVYGRNTVCHADAGFQKLMTGYEINVNNYSGFDAGPPGSSNAQYGLVVTSAGAKKITAYTWYIGTSGVPGSQYGTAYSACSVADTVFYDNNSGARAIVGGVGQHQYGVELHKAAFSGAWATAPNNSPLKALGANGIDLHPVIKLDGQDAVVVGDETHALKVPGPLFVKGNEVGGAPLPWSPTLACEGGGTPTYAIQEGSYTVTGHVVQAMFYIYLSGAGGGSGTLSLSGLPFPASSTCTRGYVALTNYQGINAGAGQTQLSGFVKPGSASAPLISTSATGSPAVALTAEMLTTSVVLQGLITYYK